MVNNSSSTFLGLDVFSFFQTSLFIVIVLAWQGSGGVPPLGIFLITLPFSPLSRIFPPLGTKIVVVKSNITPQRAGVFT